MASEAIFSGGSCGEVIGVLGDDNGDDNGDDAGKDWIPEPHVPLDTIDKWVKQLHEAVVVVQFLVLSPDCCLARPHG